MANFHTKHPNLGKFVRVLEWKKLIYFMARLNNVCTVIWYSLRPYGIFLVVLYIFTVLVCCTKKNLATMRNFQKANAPNLVTLVARQVIRPRTVTRVARWFIFKPKISIWVNFGGPWN
jgi:hypothetical protein